MDASPSLVKPNHIRKTPPTPAAAATIRLIASSRQLLPPQIVDGLREGLTLDDGLIAAIKTRIAEGATKRHVPKHIRQVTAVPYTISGKKVEMAVANMIHGEPVLNRDALANPEALEQYAEIV